MFYYGSKSNDYICIKYVYANLHNGLLNLESTPITNDLLNPYLITVQFDM